MSYKYDFDYDFTKIKQKIRINKYDSLLKIHKIYILKSIYINLNQTNKTEDLDLRTFIKKKENMPVNHYNIYYYTTDIQQVNK